MTHFSKNHMTVSLALLVASAPLHARGKVPDDRTERLQLRGQWRQNQGMQTMERGKSLEKEGEDLLAEARSVRREAEEKILAGERLIDQGSVRSGSQLLDQADELEIKAILLELEGERKDDGGELMQKAALRMLAEGRRMERKGLRLEHAEQQRNKIQEAQSRQR